MTPAERWVVVDLEATCWSPEEHPALAADQRNASETLEIGAVRFAGALDPFDEPLAETYRGLVRPRRHPQLSAFCSALTGIPQARIDDAPEFPTAFAGFLDWAGGDDGLVVASWGGFDDRQLRRDAARWGLPAPRWRRVNIRRLFARHAAARGAPHAGRLGLHGALAFLGGTFRGRPHSAVDDARNAAWVLSEVGGRAT